MSVYQGVFTDKWFSEFFTEHVDFDTHYFTSAALSREFYTFWDDFAMELEGQYAYHYGDHVFHETTLAYFLRWYLPLGLEEWEISLAAGDGISYASQIPQFELENKEKSSYYINYVAIELAFRTPMIDPFAVVLRLHHRSSVFGLIEDGEADSNFYTLGIRYSF